MFWNISNFVWFPDDQDKDKKPVGETYSWSNRHIYGFGQWWVCTVVVLSCFLSSFSPIPLWSGKVSYVLGSCLYWNWLIVAKSTSWNFCTVLRVVPLEGLNWYTYCRCLRKHLKWKKKIHDSWGKCLRTGFLMPVEGRRDRWSGWPPDWGQWEEGPGPLRGHASRLRSF
jgi:hypothetical protein